MLGATCSKVMPQCFVASCWVLGGGGMKMCDPECQWLLADHWQHPVGPPGRVANTPNSSLNRLLPDILILTAFSALTAMSMSQEMAGEGASLWDWERGWVLCVRTLARTRTRTLNCHNLDFTNTGNSNAPAPVVPFPDAHAFDDAGREQVCRMLYRHLCNASKHPSHQHH